MPYSFTAIEKDKSQVIKVAFVFLFILYFTAVWGLAILIRNYSYFEALFLGEPIPFHPLDVLTTLVIIIAALSLSALHWHLTIHHLTGRIIKILQAEAPDPADDRQKIFLNIIDEVRAATGGTAINGMIIPSLALNACTFGSGKEVPVIAVTKGLLHKLNRAQLEGVVGHEAAHIVSGDYLGTTIVSSMFELTGASLKGVRNFFFRIFTAGDSSWNTRPGRYSTGSNWGGGSRSGGRGGSDAGLRILFLIIFIVVILLIIWLVNVMATLMRMFISRQREFRADAVAVRLTRYPLGLAEALYLIANRRHGLTTEGDALRTLFIVNPVLSLWNEGEDFFSNLFSTHPPVKKRIDVLLSMARSNEEDLKKALTELQIREEAETQQKQNSINIENLPTGLWLAQNSQGEWVGPYNLPTLTLFAWVTPQTIVKAVGGTAMLPLSQVPSYRASRDEQGKILTATCPACGGKLQEMNYEGVTVNQCQQCQGMMVKDDGIAIILQRKKTTFDERIMSMAQTLLKEQEIDGLQYLDFQDSEKQYRCDQCLASPKKWRRGLFNRYYHVEVDKCLACGRTWFDKDELEVMQCMYEMLESQEQQKNRKG